MYNSAGLPTPKGSGSSGYTQSNKFLPRPKQSPQPADHHQPHAEASRQEIVKHETKRQAYLRELIRLEQALIDRGFGQTDNQKKVDATGNEITPPGPPV